MVVSNDREWRRRPSELLRQNHIGACLRFTTRSIPHPCQNRERGTSRERRCACTTKLSLVLYKLSRRILRAVTSCVDAANGGQGGYFHGTRSNLMCATFSECYGSPQDEIPASPSGTDGSYLPGNVSAGILQDFKGSLQVAPYLDTSQMAMVSQPTFPCIPSDSHLDLSSLHCQVATILYMSICSNMRSRGIQIVGTHTIGVESTYFGHPSKVACKMLGQAKLGGTQSARRQKQILAPYTLYSPLHNAHTLPPSPDLSCTQIGGIKDHVFAVTCLSFSKCTGYGHIYQCMQTSSY